jgi:hypothetical protein
VFQRALLSNREVPISGDSKLRNFQVDVHTFSARFLYV